MAASPRGLGRSSSSIAAQHRTLFACCQPVRELEAGPWPCRNRGLRRESQMTETITQSMRAIGFDAPGGPEVLRPEQLAVPSPGPGEVLVKVAYAGVNRPDLAQRLGLYPPPPGASPVPGLEIAGEVVALGAGADRALSGQQVCALVAGGGYAEYCVADAPHCLPVPAGVTLAEAAAPAAKLF